MWRRTPLSVMYYRSRTYVDDRARLPFPGYHVVENDRAPLQRPATYLVFGKFLNEVSKHAPLRLHILASLESLRFRSFDLVGQMARYFGCSQTLLSSWVLLPWTLSQSFQTSCSLSGLSLKVDFPTADFVLSMYKSRRRLSSRFSDLKNAHLFPLLHHLWKMHYFGFLWFLSRMLLLSLLFCTCSVSLMKAATGSSLSIHRSWWENVSLAPCRPDIEFTLVFANRVGEWRAQNIRLSFKDFSRWLKNRFGNVSSSGFFLIAMIVCHFVSEDCRLSFHSRHSRGLRD